MTQTALPATNLPAFEPLLCGDLWQRWQSEGKVFALADVRAAVGYMRLKPNTSCRITLFAGTEGVFDQAPPGFLLYLFPDAARARTAFEKIRGRVPATDGAESGNAPFLSESPPAVGYPYPIDPELPNLRSIYEPDRFRRALAELLPEFPESEWRIQKRLCQTRLIAYKPGRRAVYRVKVKLRRLDEDEKGRAYLHAKVCTPADAERSDANLRAVWDVASRGGLGFGVPRPRGLAADISFVGTEWVDGQDLFALLRERDARTAVAMRDAGRAIAGLHGVEFELGHAPSPPEESDDLLAHASDLAELLPEEAARISQLGETLALGVARFALIPSAIVHGDFHPGQVLLDGDRTVLVDFDAAGRGYAAFDLGSFLARLIETGAPAECASEFLAGYRETAGAGTADSRAVDAEAIDLTTAIGLFRRSVFPLRSLRSDWRAETRRLLAHAERLAQGVRA